MFIAGESADVLSVQNEERFRTTVSTPPSVIINGFHAGINLEKPVTRTSPTCSVPSCVGKRDSSPARTGSPAGLAPGSPNTWRCADRASLFGTGADHCGQDGGLRRRRPLSELGQYDGARAQERCNVSGLTAPPQLTAVDSTWGVMRRTYMDIGWKGLVHKITRLNSIVRCRRSFFLAFLPPCTFTNRLLMLRTPNGVRAGSRSLQHCVSDVRSVPERTIQRTPTGAWAHRPPPLALFHPALSHRCGALPPSPQPSPQTSLYLYPRGPRVEGSRARKRPAITSRAPAQPPHPHPPTTPLPPARSQGFPASLEAWPRDCVTRGVALDYDMR